MDTYEHAMTIAFLFFIPLSIIGVFVIRKIMLSKENEKRDWGPMRRGPEL